MTGLSEELQYPIQKKKVKSGGGMTQVSGHTACREYEKKNGNQQTTNTPMTTARTKVKRFSLFIMAFRLAAPGLLSDLDFLPGTSRAPFEVAIISLYLLTDPGE